MSIISLGGDADLFGTPICVKWNLRYRLDGTEPSSVADAQTLPAFRYPTSNKILNEGKE